MNTSINPFSIKRLVYFAGEAAPMSVHENDTVPENHEDDLRALERKQQEVRDEFMNVEELSEKEVKSLWKELVQFEEDILRFGKGIVNNTDIPIGKKQDIMSGVVELRLYTKELREKHLPRFLKGSVDTSMLDALLQAEEECNWGADYNHVAEDTWSKKLKEKDE